jgi:hypothetical protein
MTAAVLLVLSSQVLAEVRAEKRCPGTCFSHSASVSESCRVGLRGDWLDITDRVTQLSGPRASVTILRKGVERGFPFGVDVCDPGSRKSREGFIELKLTGLQGSGTVRLRLDRPGGSDTISIPVSDGSVRLQPHTYSVSRDRESTLEVVGRGLAALRVRPQADIDAYFSRPGNIVRIVEIRPNIVLGYDLGELAIIQVNLSGGGFSSGRSLDLTRLVHFPRGTPAYNIAFGNPKLELRSPTTSPTTAPARRNGPILIDNGDRGGCAHGTPGCP